ncbi:ABC transporter permease [Clostridium ljungdahlii]|uniref:ABC transporter permease n=1 Tax=Clostridium ljungdahlii TaxID=1538 RepID=UPI00386492EA
MEFSMRRVNALFSKELKELPKNINVLFMAALPVIFCAIYLKIFRNVMNSQEGKIYILNTILNMNLVMVATLIMAMLIAEEKEKNTLKTLMLTSLSPAEFLIGKALITIFISVIVNIAIFFMLKIQMQYLLMYFIITIVVLISMVEIGAVIGIVSKNQMATGTIGTPLCMFLFMIPLLSGLNKTFYKIATLLPNYNSMIILKKVFDGKNILEGSGYNIFVIFAWIVGSSLVFVYVYNRNGISSDS